jgi:enoyl-CoA hydratase
MLRQLLGPQGAAAVVLCGESLEGEEAVKHGLAWTSVDDEALMDVAFDLAIRATRAPREMVQKLKATLRAMAGVDNIGDAVELELEPQVWSVEQPAFRERIGALKRRISGKE